MARNPANAVLRGVRQLAGARSWPQRILAAVVLLLALAACLPQLQGPTEKGKLSRGMVLQGEVVGVADGDTVTLLGEGKVEYKLRLAYIDSPEKKQAFGMQAKKALSDRVYRAVVEARITDVDRYGRGVAEVRRDGRYINLEQVAEGYAWVYRQYAKKDLAAGEFREFTEAEDAAKAGRLGLWQDSDPTPPWQWRRDRRDEK